MTKKLEELLNLPESKEIIDEATQQDNKTKKQTAIVEQTETFNAMDEFDKIASALPAVKGLGEMADRELNEVADKAMSAYEDLMDLGMNVEVRYSGRIFEVASSMLKNAIDAKTAKVDKKLKAVDLQLKKLKIDRDSPEDPNELVDGTGYVMLDRNELIRKLGGKE